MKNIPQILAVFLLTQLDSTALADWPCYRGNQQRTSCLQQPIGSVRWSPAWMLQLPSPRGAWPTPARGSIWQNLSSIEPRVIDDQANVPLIATDLKGELHLVVPSSADDRLLSIDPNDGSIQWQVETDGPIRFAPSIQKGYAYFGADDGWIRAVDLRDGKIIWKSRVGPGYPLIVGNSRLVDPHPIRTSVLAIGGQVFAHAGLFPSQGVYSVALDSSTGKLLWRRRITNSSQGYLLATGQKRLYVPAGRSVPYVVDMKTGGKLFDLPSPGGTFCMLTDKVFFTGPGNSAEVQSFSSDSKAKMLSYKARQIAVGHGRIWTANGARIACHDLNELQKGKSKILWQVDESDHQGLLVSGNAQRRVLLAGGNGSVSYIDADSGELIQKISYDEKLGKVVHLAITAATEKTPETLIVSTEKGCVLAWHGHANQTQSGNDLFSRQLPFRGSILKPETEKENEVALNTAIAKLQSSRGFALIAGQRIDSLIRQLLNKTGLHVVGWVDSERPLRELRDSWRMQEFYGSRVTLIKQDKLQPSPFSRGLFNLVINTSNSQIPDSAIEKYAAPTFGIFLGSDNDLKVKDAIPGAGIWRHQYANPRNLADSKDSMVGNAAAFRLKWFGGVGPSRMPDRHLRGPAPLAAGGVLILQGDGMIIGVDPANGTERWQYQLPENSMRYVTPYDGGYVCLDHTGEQLLVATAKEIVGLNAYSGSQLNSLTIKEPGRNWGYLSFGQNSGIASLMKPTAPRVAKDRKTQRTYVDQDYRSDRPLVCSRELVGFQSDLKIKWKRKSMGLIPNGGIAVDYPNSKLLFIEGRSKNCIDDQTDRIPVSRIFEEAFLVCVDTTTGITNWEKNIKWNEASNILYTQITDEGILLTTSRSDQGKAIYYFRFFSAQDGREIWQRQHEHIKSGLFHGEQVHHPLVLARPDGRSVLVAEPFFYDLRDGRKVIPFGTDPNWAIRRPGHSCGTISGSGNCLFFRANNPTVLNLNVQEKNKFTALAPSRPGCWINIIPAGGQLLIPEASASCVCKYSLQTSMCFEPIMSNQLKNEIRILPDIVPGSD